MSQFANRLALILISAVALLAVGCGDAEAVLPPTTTVAPAGTETPPSTISDTEAHIWLQAPNGNYQTGWAQIWEEGDSLFVEVDVSPPEAVAQPAHIHKGECSSLGVIDFRLENIIGGHSISEFPGLKLKDVATGGLAINLHASFANFSTFTACGVIPTLRNPIQSGPDEAPEPLFSQFEKDY